MSDAVDHPSHYNEHPSGVECIDIVEHMTFNTGNCVKYLWRAGLKDANPQVQDLKKARWYLDREIQRLEGSDEHESRGSGNDAPAIPYRGRPVRDAPQA